MWSLTCMVFPVWLCVCLCVFLFIYVDMWSLACIVLEFRHSTLGAHTHYDLCVCVLLASLCVCSLCLCYVCVSVSVSVSVCHSVGVVHTRNTQYVYWINHCMCHIFHRCIRVTHIMKFNALLLTTHTHSTTLCYSDSTLCYSLWNSTLYYSLRTHTHSWSREIFSSILMKARDTTAMRCVCACVRVCTCMCTCV